MDGVTKATLGLAIVSSIAAVIAIWQALIARRMAGDSEKSAEAAVRQADAMEKQVTLLEQRFNADERDRLDAAKPLFVTEQGEIVEGPNGGGCRVGLRVIQDGGSALANVRIAVAGEDIYGIYKKEADPSTAKSELDLGPSVDGTVHRLWLAVDWNAIDPLEITLRIDATARDAERQPTTDLTARDVERKWSTDLALQAVRRTEPPRSARVVPWKPFVP